MTPATLSSETLAKEIRDELTAATSLPADGKVYETGQTRRTHRPATRLKVEQVLVAKYGITWRSLLVRGRWQPAEQVGETI